MKIPKSARLVYTHFGAGIALGVYGSTDDVNVTLNGLYNYGAHDNKDAHFLSDSFAYVLTTKQKLMNGLINMVKVRKTQERLKSMTRAERKEKTDIWIESLAEAQSIFDSIKSEHFIGGGSAMREYQNPALD